MNAQDNIDDSHTTAPPCVFHPVPGEELDGINESIPSGAVNREFVIVV